VSCAATSAASVRRLLIRWRCQRRKRGGEIGRRDAQAFGELGDRLL
jgi:hypothetical protein